jgi:hypothetical protein
MNQLERVQGILKRITYKPGWKIKASRLEDGLRPSVVFVDWNRVTLVVTFKAPDIDDYTKTPILLSGIRSMSDFDLEHLSDEQILDYFVRRAIWEAEDHEFKEWFKYDGICVFDPHPELKEKMA